MQIEPSHWAFKSNKGVGEFYTRVARSSILVTDSPLNQIYWMDYSKTGTKIALAYSGSAGYVPWRSDDAGTLPTRVAYKAQIREGTYS
jgi:hypothetical protein